MQAGKEHMPTIKDSHIPRAPKEHRLNRILDLGYLRARWATLVPTGRQPSTRRS